MKNKRKESIQYTYLNRTVSKDKFCKSELKGILGEGKNVRVSTDGRVMTVAKAVECDFMEDRIVEPKTGNTIEGNFVDWKQVIPTVNDDSIFVQKNFLSVKGFSKIEGFGICITDEVIISPKYMDLLEEREWVLMINGKNSPIIALDPTSPSFFLVIMPMRFDTMEKTSIDLRDLTDRDSLTEEEIEERNNLLIDTVNELTGRPKRELVSA